VKAVALPDGEAETNLEQNASLRWLHVEAAARAARSERFPVLLAGDTNLPGLSAALHRHLSGYQDGFRQASWGFGYTFPRRYPFLRLDRVLASRELRFSEFQVGCPIDVSDHLCVVARLTRR
jgi:endonuclease/exonuclease/phosphatase family metal-dependent hydrolase